MFYSYILRSPNTGKCYYGFTSNLKQRIDQHQTGQVRTTSHDMYNLVWYGAFENKKKALDFEKYLKPSSGAAFARKRLFS